MTQPCVYCGAETRRADGRCPGHADLPQTPEALAFCTRTDDCAAAVDMHDDDCPVEQELRRVFGF